MCRRWRSNSGILYDYRLYKRLGREVKLLEHSFLPRTQVHHGMDGVDGGLPQAGLFPVRTLSNFWKGGGLQAEPQGRFKGCLLAWFLVCVYIFWTRGPRPLDPRS